MLLSLYLKVLNFGPIVCREINQEKPTEGAIFVRTWLCIFVLCYPVDLKLKLLMPKHDRNVSGNSLPNAQEKAIMCRVQVFVHTGV